MNTTTHLATKTPQTQPLSQAWTAPAKRWLVDHRWPVAWLLMALVHLPGLGAASEAVAHNASEVAAWSRLGWMVAAFVFLVLKALNVRFLRVGSDCRSLVMFIVAAVLFHVLAIMDVSVVAIVECFLPPIAAVLMLLSLSSVQHGLQQALIARSTPGKTTVLELSGFLCHPAPAILPCLAHVRRRTSLPPPQYR